MENHTKTYLAVRSAVRFVTYTVMVGVPMVGTVLLDLMWKV